MNKEKAIETLILIKSSDVERKFFFERLGRAKHPIEWLDLIKEYGFLEPENNPVPIQLPNSSLYEVPYWEILDFVQNVARFNNENPNEKVTNELIGFIESVISYESNIKHIDNFRTNWVLTKLIFLLPVDIIKYEYLDYIHRSLKSKWGSTLISSEIKETIFPFLITKYPDSHPLLTHFLTIFFDYNIIEQKIVLPEYRPIIDIYWFQHSLKLFGIKIAFCLKNDGVDIAENIVKWIIGSDKSQFNIFDVPKLMGQLDDHYRFSFQYHLARFLLDCMLASDISFIKTKAEEYLASDIPIFIRLAISCLDNRYEELNDIFWKLEVNPLEFPSIKAEMYTLIKNNSASFSEEQIDKMINWVESLNFSYLNQDEYSMLQKEMIAAFKKKEWLTALLRSNNNKVLALFDKYDQINPAISEHPESEYWFEESKWVGSEVNYPEDLTEKNNSEIVEYYLHSVTSNEGDDEFDAKEGFYQLVLQNPTKIFNNITPFLKLNPQFQHSLFRAITEIIRSEKDVEWEYILSYALSSLSYSVWLTSTEDEGDINRQRFLYSICLMVKEGLNAKQISHTQDSLTKVRNILLAIDARWAIVTEPNEFDLETHFLNDANTMLYDVIYNYLYKYYKINSEKDNDIYILIDKKIGEFDDPSFIFSTGKNIPVLYTLDQGWTQHNFGKIFNLDSTYWEYAFSGCLLFINNFWKDIFFLFRDGGHLSKAYTTEFKINHVTTRLAQYICLSFLYLEEPISFKDNTFRKLFDLGNVTIIREVIRYFATYHKLVTMSSQRVRIKELFLALYDFVNSITTIEKKNPLLSDLSRWIVFYETFTPESKGLFINLAKYANINFNTHRIIKHLTRLVEKSPLESSDILISLIENDEKHPYYQRDQLDIIIKKLIGACYVESVKKICNMLIKKGLFEYRDYLDLPEIKENRVP